jgi:hypothetical protein
MTARAVKLGIAPIVGSPIFVLAFLGGTATAATPHAALRAPALVLAVRTTNVEASGGVLPVRFSVDYGAKCSLSSTPSIPGWAKSFPCHRAAVLRDALIPPSSDTASRRYVIWVSVTNLVTTIKRGEVVEQAGASPPSHPTATLTVSPSTMASTGGSLTLAYSAQGAATCTLSSSPAFWTGTNPASVNCTGSYKATVPSTTAERQWTFTFIATSADGHASTATQRLTEEAPPTTPTTVGQSLNWSGYVVPSSTPVTYASGEWTVPTVNCTATPNGDASAWVGIGGSGGTSGALLQTGVDTDCVDGTQQNVAWFNEVPSSPSYNENFTDFAISPGDLVEASVYLSSGGQWTTVVDDLTTGVSGWAVLGTAWGVGPDSASTFTEQGSLAALSYSGGYTAEWIVEDPAQSGTQAPFVDYGTVTFSDLETSLSSWSLTPDEALELVQNGTVLSTPSAPSSDGFSVSYTG